MASRDRDEAVFRQATSNDNERNDGGAGDGDAMNRMRMMVMRQRRSQTSAAPPVVMRAPLSPGQDAASGDSATATSGCDLAQKELAAIDALLPKLTVAAETPVADARTLTSAVEIELRTREAKVEELLAAARTEAADDPETMSRIELLTQQLGQVRAAREQRFFAVQTALSEAENEAAAEKGAEAGTAADDAEFAEEKEAEEAASPDAPTNQDASLASSAQTTDGEVELGARGAIESAKMSVSQETSGEETTSKRGGSLEINGDGFTATGTASESIEDKDNEGASVTDSRSVSVGMGADGFEAKLSAEQEQKFSEDAGRKVSGEIGVTGSTVSAGLTEAHTTKAEDESETTDSQGGTLSVSGDSIALGGKASTETTHKDGSGSSAEVGGTVDLVKGTGTVSSELSQTNAAGNKTSVGGELTAGKEGGSAKVNVAHGTKSVAVTGSAGAELVCKMSAPEERDGQWVVRYEKSASVSASAGARGQGALSGPGEFGAAGPTLSASGSIGGSMGQSGSGERVFATEEEALAFYAKGDFGATELPSSADDVLNALPPGASIDESSASSLDGGIGGGAGGVGVSFALSRAKESNLHAEAGPNGTLIVTLSQSDMMGATAGISSLVTVQYGEHWGTKDFQRVEFDLQTDDGKAAYELLASSKQLPATGWTLLDVGHADVEQAGVDLGMLGVLSAGVTGGVTEAKASGQSGDVESSTGTETANVSIFGMGKASETNSLAITDSAAGRAIEAHTTVDSSSGADASMQLASATGTLANVPEGDSSGKWDVTTEIPPAQAEAFLAAVEAGTIDEYSGNQSPQQSVAMFQGLREQLAAAKGDPKQRRAVLAQFVADWGDVALSRIMTFGDATPESYVTLEGDDAFLGSDGFASLERQLDDAEARVGDTHADRAQLTNDIETIQQGATERFSKLRDPKRYTDLPNVLREKELARTKDTLSRCEAMMDKLSWIPTEVEPEAPTSQARGPERQSSSTAPPPKSGASGEAAVAQKIAEAGRQRAYAARDRATHERSLQESDTIYGVRAQLDDGMVMAGPEGKTYALIDDEMKLGEAAMAFGDKEQKLGLAPGLTPTEKQSHFESARTWFDEAEHHFGAAFGEYDQIRRRHPEYDGFWNAHPLPANAAADAGDF